MKKRILPLILSVLLCVAVFCPFSAQAITPLDPDAVASLTLYYEKEGTTFADLPVSIYKVANASPDGSYHLISPYAGYPINIHGITMQEQWDTVAQTLDSYIVVDQLEPTGEGKTDKDGMVAFTELETGLYFVKGVVTENNSGTYVFNQFMIYVPARQEDDSYLYDVEAKPKCVNFVPKDQYTVTKLWQDGGDPSGRSNEITVDIYKDGLWVEAQTLNASNNWTYTWYVSNDNQGKWTVAERTVPAGYTVTIQSNDTHFSIINTRQTTPNPPGTQPNTGDSSSLMLWILLMCLSGTAMVILGAYSRRKR